jgi:hypothetical protein
MQTLTHEMQQCPLHRAEEWKEKKSKRKTQIRKDALNDKNIGKH